MILILFTVALGGAFAIAYASCGARGCNSSSTSSPTPVEDIEMLAPQQGKHKTPINPSQFLSSDDQKALAAFSTPPLDRSVYLNGARGCMASNGGTGLLTSKHPDCTGITFTSCNNPFIPNNAVNVMVASGGCLSMSPTGELMSGAGCQPHIPERVVAPDGQLVGWKLQHFDSGKYVMEVDSSYGSAVGYGDVATVWHISD